MPLKVKGEAFGATRRRTIGETLGQSARRRLARGGERSGSLSSLVIARSLLSPRGKPARRLVMIAGARAKRRSAAAPSLAGHSHDFHTAPAAIRSSAERIAHGFALALGGSLLLAISANRLRESMAAAFDNSFATLRPARRVLLAVVAKA